VRLAELKDLASRQVGDECELVMLLELTIDDILDRFPDKLIENQEKFGVLESDD
jgi:hypothetical protein